MSQNSSDLRVRRTQKLIREALIALIEERSFEAITVGEIAERAMVSRAAFYRHYQDKYALVEDIFGEMAAKVTHDMDTLRHAAINQFHAQSSSASWIERFEQVTDMQSPPPGWVKMFEHYEQYERLYRALLGKRGSAWFVKKMREYIAELLQERFLELARGLNGNRRVESRVFADGFIPMLIGAQLVDALTWWLEEGRPYSVKMIATYCYRLMCATLKEAGTWE